jgi:hypothetical protein
VAAGASLLAAGSGGAAAETGGDDGSTNVNVTVNTQSRGDIVERERKINRKMEQAKTEILNQLRREQERAVSSGGPQRLEF